MDPVTEPVVYTAGPTFLGILFIASSLLAYFLFRRDQPDVQRNDDPSTASTRGTYIPLIIGRRRTGAVILYVGDRSSEIRTEGGKGGSQQTRVYFEKGIHALCVGPAHEITQIWADGQPIMPEGMILNSGVLESGSTVTIDGHGSFRVYWGNFGPEVDPAIDELVSEQWGIDTKLPACCYIVWDKRELGPAPRWGTLEYEVTVLPTVQGIFTGDNWVQDTTDLYGVNPAWALYQLLTGPYPYGAGMPIEWIDTQSLWDVHFACGADQLSMNLLINDGRTVDEVVGDILQDIGCFLIECEGKLAFRMIRKESEDQIELVTNDMIVQPRVKSKKIILGENQRDQLIFTYKDANKQYVDGAIKREDDSRRNSLRRPNDLKVQVATMTSRHSVSRLANRRELEEFGLRQSITLVGTRNMRYLQPGAVLRVGQVAEGIGDVRVVSVKPDFEDAMNTSIECIVDAYANAEVEDYVDPDLVVEPPIGDDLAQDIRWDVFEAPFRLSPDAIRFAVPRIPASADVVEGAIHISSDNVTFTQIGFQPNSAGGALNEGWGNTTDRPITPEGPIINIDATADVSLLQDLSNDFQGWLNGKQILVTRTASGNEEIMFVRRFEALGGNQYQAKDVIRGRFATGTDEHFSDQSAYIIPETGLNLLSHAPVAATQEWWFKSQPFTATSVVPLDEIQSKKITVEGDPAGPAGPTWVGVGINGQWTNTMPLDWGKSNMGLRALQIRVAFSKKEGGGLAGQDAYDTAAIDVPDTPDGFFVVEVYDISNGGTSPVHIEILSAAGADGLLEYDLPVFDETFSGVFDIIAGITSMSWGSASPVDGSASTWWIEVYEFANGLQSQRITVYPRFV
jgi:hypothetical protein